MHVTQIVVTNMTTDQVSEVVRPEQTRRVHFMLIHRSNLDMDRIELSLSHFENDINNGTDPLQRLTHLTCLLASLPPVHPT